MLTKNTRIQAAQEDIQAMNAIRFSCASHQEFNSSFNSIVGKVVLMTWLPSMLPLVLWYMTHMGIVKNSAESVLRTCLGLGIMNALFSLVLVVFMFKSIHTYLNFKYHIKNALKLGFMVNKLVKRTAKFMFFSCFIISLDVAFSSDPITITWAWPTVFFPSFVLARVLYGVEKRHLGLNTLVRKIKRRIQEEHQQTWLKLWPNVM
jgi:hypothetical protein